MGQLQLSDAQLQAIAAALNPPPTIHVTGQLVSSSGGTLTVSSAGAQDSIATSASTKVTINGAAATVAGLKAGMTVNVASVSGTATSVVATVPVVHVTGKITAISGAQITIQETAGPVSFVTDANTKVTLKAVASTVSALRIGMNVTGTTELGTATLVKATVPVVHVTGPITAISGSQITIHETAGPASFLTDANTKVTLKTVASTVGALKVGMHVTGTTELGTATLITATVPVVHVTGPITAISGAQITIQETAGPASFLTDANTKVTLKAKLSTVAALRVGMHVTGTTELGTATHITATVPVVHVTGTITAISGAQITIQETTGPVSFLTDAGTKVTLKAVASTVGALKVGMHVTGTTELGTATLMTATVPVVHVAGTITAINGTQVTVQATTGPVTFLTDANTKITLNAKGATLADLKVSQTLTAATALGTATTVTAKG